MGEEETALVEVSGTLVIRGTTCSIASVLNELADGLRLTEIAYEVEVDYSLLQRAVKEVAGRL
jgi:uncharacterized protein (DUF433 family)